MVNRGKENTVNPEGHGVGIALVTAGFFSSNISVGVSRGEMVPLSDVSESIIVPSPFTAPPSRTVENLLLRQIVSPSSPDMSVSYEERVLV